MLSAAGAAAVFSALPTAALAADKPKVVIFGGSGYVGAYASQILLAKGADVIVASRKTPAEAQDKVKSILGKSLDGVKYVSLDATSADLSGVLSGATGVISCVGIAPGGSNQREGNGKANVRIAEAVKAAGIANFAYLGVASELSNGPIIHFRRLRQGQGGGGGGRRQELGRLGSHPRAGHHRWCATRRSPPPRTARNVRRLCG